MTAAQKKSRPKRLTRTQIKERREAKERLQADGILPPDKKKLNRKKFALEVMTRFEGDTTHTYKMAMNIDQAIRIMFPSCEDGNIIGNVSLEQIGVLKAVKMAMELEDFWTRHKDGNNDDVTIGTLYDEVIKPIYNL